jgi:hypothetical protein
MIASQADNLLKSKLRKFTIDPGVDFAHAESG